MSSILNKYKRWKHHIQVLYDKYWDFCLSQDETPSTPIDGEMNEDCLISYVNFEDTSTVLQYKYQDVEPETLSDIGLTGMDNGLILFDKEKIMNKEFLELLTGSTVTLDSPYLNFHKVSGNTKQYDYFCEQSEDGYYSFNGGFLQTFYKAEGFNYEVLPQSIDSSWHMEFVLRPRSDYKNSEQTLNDEYPNNKGIFFYMGTRAENKFAQFYNSGLENYPLRESYKENICDSIGYLENEGEIKEESTNNHIPFWRYFLNIYGFSNESNCGCPVNKKDKEKEEESSVCDNFFDDDSFLEKDIDISDYQVKLSNGEDLITNGNKFEIETDNKFLIFDRTKEGFIADTWDDNDKLVLKGEVPNYPTNLFLLMNRTKTGYTADDIDISLSATTRDYDIESDIKGNCFALKINDDGSIGYRYAIKTCDEDYVKEEYSFPNIIKDNEWSTVNVKFDTYGSSIVGERKMRIYIYVNGYLKFVSKELPEFTFRALDEDYQKQEGVPYNISLGGGTQGLGESIWLDYDTLFPYILPIEKNFAGSFIGDIKSFKFYNCGMEYNQVKNNYLYEKNNNDD